MPGKTVAGLRVTLAETRPDILALARGGKVELSQGGRKVKGEAMKGPFRVRLS